MNYEVKIFIKNQRQNGKGKRAGFEIDNGEGYAHLRNKQGHKHPLQCAVFRRLRNVFKMP